MKPPYLERKWSKWDGIDVIYFPKTEEPVSHILDGLGIAIAAQKYDRIRYERIESDSDGTRVEISYEDYINYCNFLLDYGLCDCDGKSDYSKYSEVLFDEWKSDGLEDEVNPSCCC